MARTRIERDLAAAIVRNQNYKGFDGYARQNYGISGKKLLARLVAGEAGGKGVGHAGVSSAGARGPTQFIPSTRAAYMKQYGLDPWRSNDEAIKAAIIHIKGTGLAGYNPGMPTYTNYILGQRTTGVGGTRARANTRTELSFQPGIDNSGLRQDLKLQYLAQRNNPDALLELGLGLRNAQDVPGRTIRKTVRGKPAGGSMPREAGGHFGQIFEAFYDPAGTYFDSGKFVKGGIGGHSNHVHVSASPKYVIWLGKQAQRMGLHVGENPAFDPVDPVHTQGSYHYRNRAIDVSGDPKKMARFYKFVLDAARHQ